MLQNIAKGNIDHARELRGLFEKQLKELYWAEGIMIPMLSDTIINTTSRDLVTIVEKHRVETINHLSRLEKIFIAIGIEAEAAIYEAMSCFIVEAEDVSVLIRQGVVRDAAIIAILQKIKHYEIACYGTMKAFAIALREEDIVVLLEETLQEEKEADLALSYIAESHINIEAADKEI